MVDVSRRTLLGGAAVAVGGWYLTRNSGGGLPPYAAWLGPEMAAVRRRVPVANADRDKRLATTYAVSPATIAGSGIRRDLRETWISTWGEFETASGTAVEIDPREVDRNIVDVMGTFQIIQGGVERRGAIESLESAGATRRTTHRGRDVYVLEYSTDSQFAEGGDAWEAFGVGENDVVAAYRAPNPEIATSLVTNIADTRASDATRFTASDDRVAAVVDLLGDGFFDVLHQFGGARPTGVSLALEGDVVRRRAVVYGTDETYDEFYREVLQRTITVPRGDGHESVRIADRYDSYEIRRRRNCTVFEGRLPTSAVVRADTDLLWSW